MASQDADTRLQHLGGVTASAVFGQHGVTEMTTKVSQKVIELISHRQSPDDDAIDAGR